MKKTLNASFTPASEELSEASRESLDFSTISEISDANLKEDIAELVLNCLDSILIFSSALSHTACVRVSFLFFFGYLNVETTKE